MQSEDLVFRQRPLLQDCYPMSTKEHKTVEHDSGQQLQVIQKLKAPLAYELTECVLSMWACACMCMHAYAHHAQ